MPRLVEMASKSKVDAFKTQHFYIDQLVNKSDPEWKERIKEMLDNSLMLVTALAPHVGYDNAAKIAKNALKNKTKLKEEALKSGLINEREYDKIVDPKKMINPS